MAKSVWHVCMVVGFCLLFTTAVWAGRSGIWKPDDESNSFYIQTYSTGACIVVVSPQGEDFHVFLEPECEDEIMVQEYFGRPSALELTFTSDSTANAKLIIDAVTVQYSLLKFFEGDCRSCWCLAGVVTNSLGMTFVYIPPGTFTMGSPETEYGRAGDESQFRAFLTRGFYMQTSEVTQGQWRAVMGSNPSHFSSCGDDCPVESVSWADANSFIVQLNTLGEGTYRLPREVEWEYAARAGSTTAFANGDISITGCLEDPNLVAMGWYCYNSGGATHPVARKTPNAWGLYDMHGNVEEWCQDWYWEYPDAPTVDPKGPAMGHLKVGRGGAWQSSISACRSADRDTLSVDPRFFSLGFRVVREP